MNQEFTFKEFKKLKRLTDFHKYKLNRISLHRLLSNLEQQLKSPNYDFKGLTSTKINNKDVFYIAANVKNNILDEFVLRKIDYNLKRIFSIKQSDRQGIIKQVINLLKETNDCYIYRFDIKNFYETIPIKKVQEKINNSFAVSIKTKQLLNNFISQHCKTGHLPRGINISATLSELYMKEFDKAVKNLEGVYYYARFVDDIIIFSFKKHSVQSFEKILKQTTTLELNPLKQKEIELAKTSRYPIDFDYLGYRYEIKNKKEIKIGISLGKMNKIKSKIICSFMDYRKNLKKNSAFDWLRRRILFLTSSYALKSKKQNNSKYKDLQPLHAGILYSYPFLDDDNKSLIELDNFLRTIIFKSEFSSLLETERKKELAKISFKEGYNRRITRKFGDAMKNITRCWKYVK